jgi:hypothetical protein
MAITKKITKKSLPDVTIDESLAKYKDMPLFENKIKEANEILKTTWPPARKKNSVKSK